MSTKNRDRHGLAEAEASSTSSETQSTQQSETASVNSTVPFHARVPRTGPQTRTCYTIPGVPGCLVIHLSMFKDGVAPESLTLSYNGQPVVLAEAKASKTELSAEKAAAAALKAQEKLIKAQAKIEAMAVKAEERRIKVQAAADAALARVAAASSQA